MLARPAVELAGPADVPEIAGLAMRVLEEAWSERGFAEQAAKPGAALWTARSGQGGELLGFLVAERVLDELQVLSVGVAPARRRCGVGRALVTRALEAASSAGVDVVHLELRASNGAGRSLYHSFGFAEVGRRKGYYRPGAGGGEAGGGGSAREDAVLMTLQLDQPA